MGSVTAAAFTVGVRLMGYLILFIQFCVTCVAVFSKIAGDQTFFTACMGGMTDTALSFGNGIMDNPYAKLFPTLIMAGVTENRLLVTEQTLVSGDMRVVAETALGFKYRLMSDSILEQFFVMALKAGSRVYGSRSNARKEKGQQS